MTENKRFGMVKTKFNGLYVPIDEWDQFIFSSCESELDCMRIVNALNHLHERAMSNGRIASELLNAKEPLEKENKELKEENNELKQQFILLLKKLGKKNVQCSFCEYGEHYSELVNGYYEPRFICHKKGQEYTQRSFCEDWKIKVIK